MVYCYEEIKSLVLLISYIKLGFLFSEISPPIISPLYKRTVAYTELVCEYLWLIILYEYDTTFFPLYFDKSKPAFCCILLYVSNTSSNSAGIL